MIGPRFPLNTVQVAIFLFCFFSLMGCSSSFLSLHRTSPAPSSQALSQGPMENSDFIRFRAENEERLQQCRQATECESALFHLGLAYISPESPYRDRYKALEYFNVLLGRYPRSSWTFQTRTWVALINEQVRLELNQRQLQAGLNKARADLHRAKTDLRTQENAVRGLKDQLDRSQEIDVEMERRERELLQGKEIPTPRENY